MEGEDENSSSPWQSKDIGRIHKIGKGDELQREVVDQTTIVGLWENFATSINITIS